MSEQTKSALTDDQFAIVSAIQLYGSLNLKYLSKLLDKPTATVYDYINNLKNLGVIEIDSKATNERWGKYYTLTDTYRKKFESHIPTYKQKLNERPRETFESKSQKEIEQILGRHIKEFFNLGLNAEKLRQYCQFSYFVEKFILQDFSNVQMKVISEKSITSEELMIGQLTLARELYPAVTIQHIAQYNNIIRDFLFDIAQLADDIKNEIKMKEITEDKILYFYLHAFGGTLNNHSFD
ncbi:MAG: hypothetical protein ACFFDW_04270 [Candidatus Thorarchaeota archaeon]